MTDPRPNDQPLNLEASSFDELGRVLITESRVDDCDPADLPESGGPHLPGRCGSAQRELLGNQFPCE